MTEALMIPPQGVMDIKGLDAQNGAPLPQPKFVHFGTNTLKIPNQFST